MYDSIEALVEKAKASINQINDIEQLNHVRVDYLGKKGKLTALLKGLGQLPAAERPKAGEAINSAKRSLQGLISARVDCLEQQRLQAQLAEEAIDVTLPARGETPGSLHPITHMRRRLESIFMRMGFVVVEGPEIERDYYNFEALNIPKNHPARTMQDTFYVDPEYVLRTHMSPVQIRTMQDHKPPLRIIAPGRVYRHDFDVSHTPMFHQVEGLWVDEHASFSDLKGLLQSFFELFFNTKIGIRFRASYFPFTEPSAEVDIECVRCQAKGCRVCSDTGWLEVAGSGMVHPQVLKGVAIDTEQYLGFAFGIGYDRLAMLYYGVDDLRAFFENDARFLKQFISD
jgi:phenylalanyl-tRNA synthetase alpha chain